MVGISEVEEQHSGHLHPVSQLLLGVVVFTTSHPLHSDAQTATAEEKNSTGGMEGGGREGGRGRFGRPRAPGLPPAMHGAAVNDFLIRLNETGK